MALKVKAKEREMKIGKNPGAADPGTVEDPEAEQGSGNGGNTSGGTDSSSSPSRRPIPRMICHFNV